MYHEDRKAEFRPSSPALLFKLLPDYLVLLTGLAAVEAVYRGFRSAERQRPSREDQ